MSFAKAVLLSFALFLPYTPAYEPEEEVSVVSREQVTETLSAGDHEDLTIYRDEAGTMTDEGDTVGLDIQYLLFLQDFRNSISDAWTPFMEFVSTFATRYLILGALFIYWALDKKKGLYVIASMCLTLAVNQLVKLTACVYRPWIRDSRIIPAGNAITSATGYSFPSGHTATAAPLFGGMAETSNRRHKWFPVLCVLGTMLVGFSRNYLGVHTPQDVFVAICEAVLCLIIMHKIFAYLEVHPEKEDLFLLAGIVFGFVSIAYITYKNICYPCLSITFPPPILFLYITGDMRYITHSTILREEMVVGFIDHLSCHLQRLEWRTEAVFELMRVER